MIELTNVVKTYDTGTRALNGVSLKIEDGEFVFLDGPSGSGKSTFIRCLNLLETPTEGQIIFEGSCITDKGYAVHQHREKVAMVFQQINLINKLLLPLKLLLLLLLLQKKVVFTKKSKLNSSKVLHLS